MLQKSKSKKAMLLKYGIVIPVLLISVSLFSNKIYAQEKAKTEKNSSTKDKNELSFTTVDELPRFPGCENVSKEEAMKCFNEKMTEHIKTNFTYPKEAAKMNFEGRVGVQFIIDKKGNIKDISTKGPENSELLEAEAKRIVSLLPKFIPAKHNGKAVNIKYGLPITFKLQDK